ncbi:hypothetical protein B0H14DRAFT_3453725 [Mycena olivaceomarginata]|nr:hypothetical protein B0H14DRAFT_3453725 [Mycena olivaceomarginata]
MHALAGLQHRSMWYARCTRPSDSAFPPSRPRSRVLAPAHASSSSSATHLRLRVHAPGFTYARRRPAFPSLPSPPPSGPRSLPAHTPRTPPHPRPTMQGRVAVAYERTGHIQGTTMPSTRPHSPTRAPFVNACYGRLEYEYGATRTRGSARAPVHTHPSLHLSTGRIPSRIALLLLRVRRRAPRTAAFRCSFSDVTNDQHRNELKEPTEEEERGGKTHARVIP